MGSNPQNFQNWLEYLFSRKNNEMVKCNISDKFWLIITPLTGNIDPSYGDIMGGPKWRNNKSKMAEIC